MVLERDLWLILVALISYQNFCHNSSTIKILTKQKPINYLLVFFPKITNTRWRSAQAGIINIDLNRFTMDQHMFHSTVQYHINKILIPKIKWFLLMTEMTPNFMEWNTFGRHGQHFCINSKNRINTVVCLWLSKKFSRQVLTPWYFELQQWFGN